MSDASDPAGPEPQPWHLLDYLHVVLRRKWLFLAVFLAATTLSAIRTFTTRPVYQASTQILIERVAPSVVTFKEVSEVNAGYWGDDYYQTQYKLLQSRSLARKVVERANLLQDAEFGGPRPKERLAALRAAPEGQSPEMEGVTTSVLGRISVQPVRNSRLVTVSAEAFRPELAATLANTLSELYIEQALEHRYETSAEAGRWLGGQVEEQRRKVEDAERALQKVMQRDGIVNIEERRLLLDQKLKELGTSLTGLRTTRLEKEALYQQMKGAANPEDLPQVIESPLVQSLRIELANLERQETLLLERYLDQHPEVVKVRRQVSETRGKVRQHAAQVIRAAENDYKAAAAQEASVAEALEAAKAEALELSRRAVTYDTLKRDLEASKEMTNGLLARHKQTDVAQELKSSNIRIVDRAVVPQGPVRPVHGRDVLMGLLMGLSLGLGLVFFLEYLDNTLKTPDDVRQHLGVPLLGVIPEVSGDRRDLLVNHSWANGPFLEGYRVVRTALNYSWSERGARVLAVTSTSPGEGKTLTSANLALTLASMEGSVLLVDGDLRKPQAHELLGGARGPGLSDVLVGQVPVSHAIRRVPGTNMSLLPAGTHVPSPADLITNRAMGGLLDELRRQHTWIILDTPPVGAVADALVFASFADGVVAVAGAEMVPRKAVLHTLERIAETGARLLGVVLNRAQVDKHSYYYSHYYGHYYGRYHDERKVRRIDEKRAAG